MKALVSVVLFLFASAFLFSCHESRDLESITIKEGRVLINGSPLYYQVMGQGEPIIIIHGGPLLDHTYLEKHLKPMATKYQLIFYDQRASGRSSFAVDTTTMSLHGFAEDIELLRKELNLGKVHIYAHSWGGLISMKYMLSYPDAVKSWILSNSIPASSKEWKEEESVIASRSTPYDSLQRINIMTSDAMKNNPTSAIHDLLMLAFKTQVYDTGSLRDLELVVPRNYMQRSMAMRHLGPDLASFNLYPELSGITVPTLIMYGSMEPAAEISAENLAETLPNATLQIIEDCGHFPFIEESQHYERIEEFLESTQ